MIEKERGIPDYISKLEALIRRIPDTEPGREKAISELRKRRAGYKGEQKLDYYLSFLDEKEYKIFHGLRLLNGKYYFQIDTLVLTKKYAIIIEVKNWNGTIIFEPDFHQLIRILNDKEEAFHDPLSQAEHQQRQFKKWLRTNGYPDLPIEYAVVISSPSTIIKSPYKQISDKVLHAHRLISKISSVEKTNPVERLNEKEVKKISKTLLKKHVPHKADILKLFNINHQTLLTGVHCPKCSALPMIFHWGKWHCSSCKAISTTAHHQALQDYFHLIKPRITSKEFREFTHVSSLNAATRLLSNMGIPFEGERSKRIYHKNPEL
ncbi:hypothetical protein AF332_16925 [Sporosarcina globispora]|uniref:NERD domain-containing protein n=1 Tax=Sporosarcina globispora TaxID=1459 RepID=A0A0M0GFQ5_SPOGL|nr:nuclease-related domain-containing protein [Sporosarcina globispora]KON88317.1 hypothetical protein AF332_16925 [Sporosarcina globispora]